MAIYKNEEYLKSEIMDYNRHQFIYGYDDFKREVFLKLLTTDYPVELDSNLPMAIYVKNYGLPNTVNYDLYLNKNKVDTICQEYLYFSIALELMIAALDNNDLNELNNRIKGLLNHINRSRIDSTSKPIENIDDLISALKKSQDYYYDSFICYCERGLETKPLDSIPLPFIQISNFIRDFKNDFNSDNHVGILINKHNDIAFSSTRAINCLINSRCNKDMSMKVALTPGCWDTYTDLNGQFIESIHDYGTVELDDSYQEHLKRVRKN